MVLKLLGRDGNSFILDQNKNARERRDVRNGNKSDSKISGKSINMSRLGLNIDSVLFRKQSAKGRAMKLINDAWARDKKVDDNMNEISSDIDEANSDIAEFKDIISGYNERKDKLKDYYGIEDENFSKEDEELLAKDEAAAADPKITLTKEEQDRLEELKDTPLYKYRQETKGVDAAIENYEKKINNAYETVKSGNAQIRGIKLERLKYHDMVDEQKKADKINAEASKEAIGIMVGEAKDHIKEKLEEKVEEAKKSAKEKEEQEEKLNKRKEEQEEFEAKLKDGQEKSREAEKIKIEQKKNAREQSDIIKDAKDDNEGLNGLPSQIKSEIKEMLQKMKLLDEDLKGAEIDDTV